MIDYVRVKYWDETRCEIQSARLDEYTDSGDGDLDTYYRVRTRYRYEYGDRFYIGTRYGLDENATNNRRRHANAVKFLRENPSPTCFVNPKNPHEVVISRAFSASMLAVLIPFSLFLLFGGLSIYGVISSRKPRRRLPG